VNLGDRDRVQLSAVTTHSRPRRRATPEEVGLVLGIDRALLAVGVTSSSPTRLQAKP
jgi:hypothetical protein